MTKVKFGLGRVVCTPGALELAGDPAAFLPRLARHARGDWGLVDGEDRRANDEALVHGLRVLSAYVLGGRRVWVITEADRSVTTVLLPGEY